MKIFVLNCGSSSIKYKFYNMPEGKVLASGLAEKIGLKSGRIIHKGSGGQKITIDGYLADHQEGIRKILDILQNPDYGCLSNLNEIEAVGHRVVHGGEIFSGSVLITE
ncbi:MAG: acetate kinase, partial [Bacteroidales bacterium]|nr:acetate kinase [Bacteroidales bacterium]